MEGIGEGAFERLIIWDTTNFKAILIENASISGLFRQKFEILWGDMS